MNREDAAREIDNTACCFSDKRFRDAMHMAAAALRGHVPDPETGLVPCRCGGKPHEMMSKKGCYLQCDKCGARTGFTLWSQDSKPLWNRAMGYNEEVDNG